MKNALILHGMPDKKDFYNPETDSEINCHWLPWLHHQLMIRDILTQVPSMPKPYEPVYKDWAQTIEQFKIDKDSILIGHSCGGGFWLRYISENDIKIDKLILVAPWLDLEKEIGDFFNFKFNLRGKINKVVVFNSEDDYDVIKNSVEMIKRELPTAEVRSFKDKGHFTLGDMKTREFPELLEAIIV